MPKNARSRTAPDVNAGVDREPDVPVPVPAAPPVPEAEPTKVKFTALIDPSTVQGLKSLEATVRSAGRHPVLGRYPSRADVLRELVALAADDADLTERITDRIRVKHAQLRAAGTLAV